MCFEISSNQLSKIKYLLDKGYENTNLIAVMEKDGEKMTVDFYGRAETLKESEEEPA